jgi:CBS domain-containing protein
MNIAHVLARKGVKVFTIGPDQSIRQAVAALAQHNIGALVVVEEGGRPVGILSERDIVRALGARGVSCLEGQVQDLMTAEVIGCHPEDTAISVLERMTDGRFRHMPVIQDNAMIGVISIGDVVKARITEVQSENAALTEMISNAW